MAIKALFTEGSTSIELAPLYQWDYGQELEIEAAGLPSLIEVHFACTGMNEAVVHTCSSVNNIATVAIPDRCLEQPNEITAWVYEIDGTAGRTIYSIHIPITARTRPARSESIPQSVQDTYTQLITEVNELLDALQSGEVNVGYATKAVLADKATTADSATTAITANTAGAASTAASDANGNNIANTYMRIPDEYTVCSAGTALGVGFYVFRILVIDEGHGELHAAMADIGGLVIAETIYSSTFSHDGGLYRLQFGSGNNSGATYTGMQTWDEQGGTWRDIASTVTVYVYYKKLMS